jgi:hypothetical protein
MNKVTANKLRMTSWLLLAIVFYGVAYFFKEEVQLSTGLWKAGHVTAGAYLGYWIDRHTYGRLEGNNPTDGRLLSRAILMAAAVVGLAFGL